MTTDEIAFSRRWVRKRNDALAVTSSLISLAFHLVSLVTDPHVASARFLPLLTSTHLFVIGVLGLWLTIGRRFDLKLRHVLHFVNFVAVSSYIFVLHMCISTAMPQEDRLLASVAVSMLSVYAILLSPCRIGLIIVTAAAFWTLSSWGYGDDPVGVRWIIINALALTSAVAFQASRLMLAQQEGLREYSRLRLLGERARGEVRKRKKVEIQLEETASRAVHASKMAFLSEMTGGIAHEIDNPLSALQLRAETMRERALKGGVTTDEFVEFTRRVEVAVKRIGRIVKGIRRVVRKGDVDDFEKELLSTIVDDVVEICQGRLKTHRTELRINVPSSLSLSCSVTEIGQVLLNLVSNAADAVESLDERWIDISARLQNDWVVISVTDSGNGISPEQRARIFEPFYTTKDRGKGNGLGLGIVKSIVERHGGTIEIDAASQHTRFLVRLPVDDKPSTQKAG